MVDNTKDACYSMRLLVVIWKHQNSEWFLSQVCIVVYQHPLPTWSQHGSIPHKALGCLQSVLGAEKPVCEHLGERPASRCLPSRGWQVPGPCQDCSQGDWCLHTLHSWSRGLHSQNDKTFWSWFPGIFTWFWILKGSNKIPEQTEAMF